MSLYRLFLPLLFALALLLAQQTGIAHTLQHTLAGQSQQDKQAPQTHSCELCALDAQLGSALNSPSIFLVLACLAGIILAQNSVTFKHAHTLAATARSPPASLPRYA